MKKRTIYIFKGKTEGDNKEKSVIVDRPENFHELTTWKGQTDEEKFDRYTQGDDLKEQAKMRTPPKVSDEDKRLIAGVKKISQATDIESKVNEQLLRTLIDNPSMNEKDIIALRKKIEVELKVTPKK